MPPIQLDSLAINFEFDIRPREVRPAIRCFCFVIGQLILRKISKIGATRCQILRLKCTKFDFPLGLRPKPCWGSLQRSSRPLAVFEGPTSKGREKEGGGEERDEKRRVREKEGVGRGWEGREG